MQAYDVLVRICEGLGVPRGAMGLGLGAYAVDGPAPQLGGEDEEDVLRRQFAHLLALAGAALVGAPVPGVGKLLADPSMPRPISDVPSRIGRADVEVVRELTRAVADVAITLAPLHVRAGEPDRLRLAAQAISAVTPLRSGVARAGLGPLADVLEGSKSVDLRELARRARQAATTRA